MGIPLINKIIYFIENTLWRKRSVQKAMRMWEEKTCIRFKERTNEEDYVEFFADFGK